MIQLSRILTEKLDFDKPFRIIIDYDPEQTKVNMTYSVSSDDK